MDDASSSDYLAEIIVKQAESLDNQKFVDDCIRIIKLNKLSEAINNIRTQIRESQNKGQVNSQLLKRYRKLVEEQKSINNRKYNI